MTTDDIQPQPGEPMRDPGHHHPHSGPSALDCSEALLRAFEFLDGEMEAGDFAKVRAHLDACAECLRQYDLDHMAVSYTHLTLPTNREG